MRELEHPAVRELTLDGVLSALADPVRRRIVHKLARRSAWDGWRELPCLALDLPVSKSTATHHFRVLREAGLIQQRREGTAILNSLRHRDLEDRFPGLLPAIIRAHDQDPDSPADE
ncbi:ArsR/SmtB family transcription factor [Corynebacterium halotolerans]|uniref:Transcriptional regulator, ArsR family protein n=1 Tax=Corynebacterium halotolerans YIM 70093 = DSM 44683 TaxID=1121362 RepID=M1NWZ1_9CORY|nr:metalloregulator ArsR/SmtB family transcription factor [Corynebacterium halotolerans]AGF71995.1 transcriptional regulator, ArsR family protein [Corynebacterium halotolerans YIM 70093 = DSM 44683]